MRHDYTTRSLRSILLDCLDYIESDPVPTTRGKRLIDEGHAALIETAVAGREYKSWMRLIDGGDIKLRRKQA